MRSAYSPLSTSMSEAASAPSSDLAAATIASYNRSSSSVPSISRLTSWTLRSRSRISRRRGYPSAGQHDLHDVASDLVRDGLGESARGHRPEGGRDPPDPAVRAR